MRLEFNHAVCRPCPEAGPCVGLTGEGVVASVMDPSLAARQGLAEQYTSTVSGSTFTKLMHVRYESGNVQTGFDMGYIKMQAVGPGQCVVKADLTALFEGGGTTWMPAPDGNPIIGWGGRTEKPKIPVAANKLVNCPPGGCLPSAPPTPPTPPPPSPPPPPPPPPSHREVWTYNAATRMLSKKSFKILGHIDGREILNKSKNCTRKWWPKWKKTKKATCTNKGKTATCMKLKNKCTVPVEDYA